MNAGEAASLLDNTEGIIVLDVRTQEEYDGGHLPGAVCLPVETMTDGDPVRPAAGQAGASAGLLPHRAPQS